MRIRSAVALCILSVSLSGCQDIKNVVEAGLSWLQVQNSTSFALEELYVPGCGGGSLGPDRLSAGQDLAPGAMTEFEIPSGCYNVTGDFADGQRRVLQNVRVDPDLRIRVTFTN